MSGQADPKPVKQTHCKHGHSLEDAWVSKLGSRNCRTCRRLRNAAYKQRVKPWRNSVKAPAKRRTLTCPDCGAKRHVVAGPNEVRRCKPCQFKAMRTGRMRTCPCGQEFYVQQGETRNFKFCSLDCRRKYGGYTELASKLAKKRRGRGNPNFKSGDYEGRKNWGVAAKGELFCRNCGATQHLHLHHVIPRSKFRGGRAELLNGIPLCARCHNRWHAGQPIYRDIFTVEEWAYLSSVELTGENIGPWLDKRYPERPAVAA